MIESLEARALLSAPVIGSLVSDPAGALALGEHFSLTARNVTADAGVQSIEFYRDSNNDGVLEIGTDQHIRPSTLVNGEWTTVTTAGRTGPTLYFAQARSNNGDWGDPAALVVNVPRVAIAAKKLWATPSTVDSDRSVTLELVATGSIARVEFYRDRNNNGKLDLGVDRLIGKDTSPDGGWTWQGAARIFPVGTSIIFGRAVNDLGYAKLKRATVEVAPVSRPQATLLAKPEPLLGESSTSFTVQFRDPARINMTTVDGAIQVTDSKGNALSLSRGAISSANAGRTVNVVYQVIAPHGMWDAPQNGVYTIRLLGKHLANKTGRMALEKVLGTFEVSLKRSMWSQLGGQDQ